LVPGATAMRRNVMPEPPRPQLFLDLLGTPQRQGPAQERTDLGLTDIELMGQDPGVVPVPGTPGLQIVQTRNLDAVDEHRRDGLLADSGCRVSPRDTRRVRPAAAGTRAMATG
jgi:hypothetical protein